MSSGIRLSFKRNRAVISLGKTILIVFSILSIITSTPAQDPKAIEPLEKIDLFNGKDLSSFYSWLVDHHYEDPKRVISVVDQIDGSPAVRVSGEHWGGFTTLNNYRNYRLIVEFRWGLLTWGNRKNATRDSGILLHCQGVDGNTRENFNGPWMRSIETQIIEGGVGDFILVAGYNRQNRRITPQASAMVKQDRDGEPVFDPTGKLRIFEGGRINWSGRDPDWKDILGFRGRQDVESRSGEWTKIEVICEGDTITNLVNDRLVNRVTKTSLNHGKIMFQSEGAEIYFRRIELLPLD